MSCTYTFFQHITNTLRCIKQHQIFRAIEDEVHINAGMLCSSRTFSASSSASASEGHQSHKHIHTWHHTLTHPYAQHCMGMKACVFKQKRMVKWAGEEAGQSLCIRKVTFKTHGLEGPINQPAHTAALRTA